MHTLTEFKKRSAANRAWKQHRRKICFKKWKRAKRRGEQGLKKIDKTLRDNIRHKYYDYKKITAPELFSLIKNEKETIKFIDEIKKYYEKKQKVFIVLRHVKEITNDALLVLLSNMIRFRSHNIAFDGDFPKDSKAKNEIMKSGFFQHLYNNVKHSDIYSVNNMKQTIYTHAQKNVSSELANSLIAEASVTVWGEKRRCLGVQSTLLELMQNTNNHASEVPGEKHWWVSINNDKENKVVTFSFIDFGKGIFNSLNNKKPGETFYNWRNNLRGLFPNKISRADDLKLILEGQLHRTVTKNYFRGKGLPGIYDAYKENKLSSLVIITNNVYANIANNDFHLMDNELIGTFVSWEIKATNINLPWI